MWKVIDSFHGKSLVIAINIACGFSIFAFGYDQGLMAGVNVTDSYLDIMDLHGKEEMRGGVVASYYCGSLIGSFVGGWTGDKLGRIKCIALGCLWGIVGATLQTAAMNVPWMICSRIVTGVATGYLNAIVPVWSAETSHATSRGMFIAMEFTLNIFGVVVAYWIAFGMSFTDQTNSVSWRFPIAFQMLPQIILFTMIFFFPESPRWLLKNGREKECLEVLAALRGDGDQKHPEVVREFKEIEETLRLENNEGGEPSFYKMMFEKDQLNIPRRVHLTVWLQIIQQLVGIGVITIYAPEVFINSAGFSRFVSQLLSGINNISYMFSTLVAVFTLDRWGRRFTMFYGAVGQGIALLMVAILTKPEIISQNPTGYGIGTTVFIFAYTALFGMTWLTVTWLYPVEIYPLRVRARGGAWSTIGWSIGNGLVTLSTPPLLARIGWATFLLYAGFNFLAIPVIWALYPETANLTLEELDVIFSTKAILVKSAEKELRGRGIDPKDPLAHLLNNSNSGVSSTKQYEKQEIPIDEKA
ncbi:general substrate transporter [Phascolomyces articulosus]|uniref:General substrate transporter n=1 Tax=Phascolomyces articulosus TaxID=60185 RepID=A0AAD5K2W3_9FUNG|nr:general substrate transporter [Phascolomyces articulosus]